MNVLILIIILLSLSTPSLGVSGGTLDPGSTIYTGRQLGLGGAATAIANDASATLSNPALLSNLAFPQMIASSRKLALDETQYTLIGWAMPTDWGILGLAYTDMFTNGSLPTKLDSATGRVVIDPSREATSYDNNLLAFSYARQFTSFLSLGLNYKMYKQSLTGDTKSSGSAAGFDLGAAFYFSPWLKLGASLQNLTGASISWESGASDKIGGYYKLGASANLLGPADQALFPAGFKLNLGADLDLPNAVLASSNSSLYHLGLEFIPLDKIFFRLGLNQEAAGSSLSYGLGLENGGFRFDYAYLARPNLPGDNPHYFSIAYVGERVFSSQRKLKSKQASLKFLAPADRLITDQPMVVITAEAKTVRVMDETFLWTVTGVAATKETHQAEETEALFQAYLNGKSLGNETLLTSEEKLAPGRNVFELIGYTSPDAETATAETMTAKTKALYFVPPEDLSLDYWAGEPIALCLTLDLIKGYPDGTFQPEKGISRAELTTLLVRSLGLPDAQLEAEAFTDFTDLPQTHWSTKYVAYAVRNKLTTGYPDNTFKPNNIVNRAEGITILTRYAQLTEEAEAKSEFPDLADSFWANKYIAPAKAAGLLKYLEGKEFSPSAQFTRAEACEVLYRTPQIQKMKEDWWETGVVVTQQTQQQPTAPAPTSEAQ